MYYQSLEFNIQCLYLGKNKLLSINCQRQPISKPARKVPLQLWIDGNSEGDIAKIFNLNMFQYIKFNKNGNVIFKQCWNHEDKVKIENYKQVLK